ncbi:MAG: glycosyltransferase family 2 protein [Leptospirales bacterium]|jgi:glycosyltransferase involved in cell wall biosynthesis
MQALPSISVLMPVYNAERFVEKAIRSVLNQTFKDFELVIVNDGSRDRSVEIIEAFDDSRIRLVHNEQNMGLARVRNRLLELARAPYIAWLDSDDYSEATRLRVQFDYLENNSSAVLCGGFVRPFDHDSGRSGRVWQYPTDPQETKVRLLFDDPLATSAVMVRRNVFVDHKIEFRLEYPPAEDYDVWERVAQHGDILNLNRVLTHYRIHANQSSTAGRDREIESVRKIQERQLNRFGIVASGEEREVHLKFGLNDYSLEYIDAAAFSGSRESSEGVRSPGAFEDAAETWLERLLAHNEDCGFYQKTAFRAVIADRWYRVCYARWKTGWWAFRRYRASPLAAINGARRPALAPFVARCAFAAARRFMTKPGPWSGTV